MACCDHEVDQISAAGTISYADLPEETFCCMGRVMYTVSTKAETFLLGKAHPEWSSLNERQKMELAAFAKRILVERHPGDSPLEKLMVSVLTAMTSSP